MLVVKDSSLQDAHAQNEELENALKLIKANMSLASSDIQAAQTESMERIDALKGDVARTSDQLAAKERQVLELVEKCADLESSVRSRGGGGGGPEGRRRAT